jgi:hypothetical protein
MDLAGMNYDFKVEVNSFRLQLEGANALTPCRHFAFGSMQ